MSDKMFDEVLMKENKYNFRDWKLYAIHDETKIHGFFGDYRWLSNFYKYPVYFEGWLYPSTENAYQAAKVEPEERWRFQNCSPAESKKLMIMALKSDNLDLAYKLMYDGKEWDTIKYDVMSVIVFDKFYRSRGLRQRLVETGDKHLEETNHWDDQYWGVDIKNGGQNNLGKILMKMRNYWK